MRSDVSALLDGELADENLGRTLDGLAHDGALRAAWDDYCLIGDAMRRGTATDGGFAARVMDRLDAEPTVVAPAAAPRPMPRRGRSSLALAASLAAVSVVGWLAMNRDQPGSTAPAAALPSLAVAQRDAPAPAPSKSSAGEQAVAESVPPPAGAVIPYLVVHQGYGSAGGMQGVAQYVRVVSDTRGDPAR